MDGAWSLPHLIHVGVDMDARLFLTVASVAFSSTVPPP